MDNEETKFIQEDYTDLLIAYKNILIKVGLFAKGDQKVEVLELSRVSKEILEFIKAT